MYCTYGSAVGVYVSPTPKVGVKEGLAEGEYVRI